MKTTEILKSDDPKQLYFGVKHTNKIVKIDNKKVYNVRVEMDNFGLYFLEFNLRDDKKLRENDNLERKYYTHFRYSELEFEGVNLNDCLNDKAYQTTKKLVGKYANGYEEVIVARKVENIKRKYDSLGHFTYDVVEEEVLDFINIYYLHDKIAVLSNSRHKEVRNLVEATHEKLGTEYVFFLQEPQVNGWVVHAIPINHLYLSSNITEKSFSLGKPNDYNFYRIKRELLKIEL